MLTQYIKSLFDEILRKIVHLAVALGCIHYRPCVLEFTAGL